MRPFEPPPFPFSPPTNGIDQVLEGWERDPKIWKNVVLDRWMPCSTESSIPLPEAIAPAVRYALKARGIHRLYQHQAEAFFAAQAQKDLVVATPTASGKSLCYHLPVLDALIRDPEARALYLFPTKALSRDQESSLKSYLTDAGFSGGAITYDGDTPQDARKKAREQGRIIVSNPDMVHAGILPQHPRWARLFANLKFVVVDELHIYRGVFGSHLANLLRRLFRVAAFHGASPQLICCSATIGNPAEHAARLCGREVVLVDQNGAPQGKRRILIYNPPVVNAELSVRASYVKTAVRLAVDLVRADVSTLIFGQSRNQVEVMLKYLRDALSQGSRQQGAGEWLASYRGGYLAQTRRRIEDGLREGRIKCVVATNALELGIDVGALDAVICAGYPGSISGLWQRFGRAGRRQGTSLGLMVSSSAPLDQYLAKHPGSVVEAPVEQARIDPNNTEIFVQHLKCASFELPFEQGESFGDVQAGPVGDALEYLASHGLLRTVSGRGHKTIFHWTADVYPASDVSLRNPGWDNFAIIDIESQKTIAEMDFRSAHTMLHEQAIYQHEAEQYQVEVLDFENHKAFVRSVEPDYYTTAKTRIKVTVLEQDHSDSLRIGNGPALPTGRGEINVVEKVIGFKKIKFHTHENVGYGEVNLPEMQKPTTAFWLVVPEELLRMVAAPRGVLLDGLRGWAAAMKAVAAVGLMMDPRDLAWAVVDERSIGDSPADLTGLSARRAGLPGGARLAGAPDPGHLNRLGPAALRSFEHPGGSAETADPGHLNRLGPAALRSFEHPGGSAETADPGHLNRLGPAALRSFEHPGGSAETADPGHLNRLGPAALRSFEHPGGSAETADPGHLNRLGPAALRSFEHPGGSAETADPGHLNRLGPAALRSFEPTVYLYDVVAGGVGLAQRLFEERRLLLLRADQLVRRCPCSRGCPSCIGPVVDNGPVGHHAKELSGASGEPWNAKQALLELSDKAGLSQWT